MLLPAPRCDRCRRFLHPAGEPTVPWLADLFCAREKRRKTAFPLISALFIIFSIYRNNKDLNQVLCEFYFWTSLFVEVLERHFLRIYLASLFLFCKCGDHMSIPRCTLWRDQVMLCVFRDIMHVTVSLEDLPPFWLRKESQPNLLVIIPLCSTPEINSLCTFWQLQEWGIVWKDRGQEP